MGFATSQQINQYYETYKTSSIAFTKEVIQALSFNTQQSVLRLIGGDNEQTPCIINSVSMSSAKVIVPKNCVTYEKISGGINTVNLKFSFFESGGKADLAFFVSGKVTGARDYNVSPDLVLFNIEYTQRAPDDLIEKLGSLLDAKMMAPKRTERRIELTDSAVKKLGLAQKETIVAIQNIPRRCILRDISLTGAKFVMAGGAPVLLNKDCVLKFTFEDPDVILGIRGKIIRAELVEGRKDLIAVAMNFTDSSVSLAYKLRLTQFFNQQRKINIGNEEEPED